MNVLDMFLVVLLLGCVDVSFCGALPVRVQVDKEGWKMQMEAKMNTMEEDIRSIKTILNELMNTVS